jgi:RNA polymerase sigma factor (sigma-70 family)
LDLLTDNSLMLMVKNGDLGKMSLLFERYHKPLFTYLFHQTGRQDESEDLVQTVFYIMLKKRHSFSPEGIFRAWMYQIARNIMINAAKKNNRMVYKENLTENETAFIEPGADNNIEQKEKRLQLQIAISRLPDDQKEVLILSKYQELPYKEIAAILKTTEANVKIKVFRAVQELKKLYKK